MTTWDEGFAERYAEWSAHMTADIAFYVDLARQASGPRVELAIGNGRVAIPIARATGQPAYPTADAERAAPRTDHPDQPPH